MVNQVGFKSQSSYGEIKRIDTTPEGRVIYQVTAPDGQVAGGLSVAANDCDKFERSYEAMMEAAPKLENYMKTHTEEDLKSNQKKGRWITGIGAFIGGMIPAVCIHKIPKLQWLIVLAGAIAGGVGGFQIAKKVTIPPGAEQMTKASQELSKLDIKPL